MFDIGFWELVVIAIVALLVLGPERLPEFAVNAGRWFGKLKRFINHTRRELESELRITEQKSFQQSLTDLDDLMKNAPDNRKKNNETPAGEDEKHSNNT